MRTETLSLVISGDGKLLSAELGRSERKVKTFSGRVGGMLTGVGRRFGGALGKLVNPWALIGGAAGAVMAARNLADYQDAISTLGISAGMSTEKMVGLERRIQSTAYTTGQSREALTGAMRDIIDATGDVDFALASIENIGRASTAMSVDIKTAAQAFGAFRRDMGATAEEAAALYNTMATVGNHTMSMDRFARSVNQLGLTRNNFAEYNALIKTIAPTFGGAEAAANAVDQIVERLSTRKSAQRRIGSDLFNTDGTIKDYRTFIERISRMDSRWRERMFGRNLNRAFLPFESASGLQRFDEFLRQTEKAEHLTNAFIKKQGEAKFQFNALTTAGKEFAGLALGPVMKDITEWMNKLISNPAEMERFKKDLTSIASLFGDISKVLSFGARSYKGLIDDSANFADRASIETRYNKIPSHIKRELVKKHRVINERGHTDAVATQKAVLEVYRREFFATEPIRQQRLDDLIKDNKVRRPAGLNHFAAEMRDMWTSITGKASVNNTINVNVEIAKDGRVIAQTDSPNTRTNVTANRGQFR